MSNQNFNHDPIFINMSSNTGINSTNLQNINASTSILKFQNQDIVINNPDEYYLSLNRCNIATGTIPIYIFPIKNGQAQNDPNLSPFIIKFTYIQSDSAIFTYSDNVLYIPSNDIGINPLSPAQNSGVQDLQNSKEYYYIFSVSWMLYIFNNNIRRIFGDFVQLLAEQTGVNIPDTSYPFYTFDFSSRLFSLNFPKTYFDTDLSDRVEMRQDLPSADLFSAPYSTYLSDITTPCLMMCRNLYDNTVQYNSIDYYKMISDQSSLTFWVCCKRIVFVADGLPIKRPEYDCVISQIPFTASNPSSAAQIQRPQLNIFFDLNVDADQFAVNSNVLNYSVSSIAESRLVSLCSGQVIQNFSVSIYWVDNYSQFHALTNYPDSQNLLKLCFYRKSTMLL